MLDDFNNQDEPDEAVEMLLGKKNIGVLYTDSGLANGSSGHTLVEHVCFFFFILF